MSSEGNKVKKVAICASRKYHQKIRLPLILPQYIRLVFISQVGVLLKRFCLLYEIPSNNELIQISYICDAGSYHAFMSVVVLWENIWLTIYRTFIAAMFLPENLPALSIFLVVLLVAGINCSWRLISKVEWKWSMRVITVPGQKWSLPTPALQKRGLWFTLNLLITEKSWTFSIFGSHNTHQQLEKCN